MLLLSEASSRHHASRDMSNDVLTFVAESVNVYNWYLRRTPNPRSQLYDDTEEVMHKLFEELYKRAKEDPEVSIKLKNAVWMFNLADGSGSYDADVLEEEFERLYDGDADNMNSRLWCYFVQRRQRDLVHHNVSGVDAECEQMVWNEVAGTLEQPELYTRLVELESEYLEMLAYSNANVRREYGDESSLSENLYNSFEMEAPRIVNLDELVPPAFGVEVELERVYLRDPQDQYQEQDQEEEEAYEPEPEEVALRVVDKQFSCEFECPLCYDTQEYGSEGVRTTCGHEYCEPCFSSMVARKHECGMCRAVIVEYTELIVV
jgi:hypothetical protein